MKVWSGVLEVEWSEVNMVVVRAVCWLGRREVEDWAVCVFGVQIIDGLWIGCTLGVLGFKGINVHCIRPRCFLSTWTEVVRMFSYTPANTIASGHICSCAHIDSYKHTQAQSPTDVSNTLTSLTCALHFEQYGETGPPNDFCVHQVLWL